MGQYLTKRPNFFTVASMNFMEHKRVLRSTADVLTIHDLELHSATDVRLERDVSTKLTCSIAPSGNQIFKKDLNHTRSLKRFTLNVLITFIWVGKKLLHQ